MRESAEAVAALMFLLLLSRASCLRAGRSVVLAHRRLALKSFEAAEPQV